MHATRGLSKARGGLHILLGIDRHSGSVGARYQRILEHGFVMAYVTAFGRGKRGSSGALKRGKR